MLRSDASPANSASVIQQVSSSSVEQGAGTCAVADPPFTRRSEARGQQDLEGAGPTRHQESDDPTVSSCSHDRVIVIAGVVALAYAGDCLR